MDYKDLFVLVALQDKVVGNFGYPTCFENLDVAKRAFIDLVQKNDQIKNHLADFVFYHIGYYNSKTGEIFSKFNAEEDVIMTASEAFYLGDNE